MNFWFFGSWHSQGPSHQRNLVPWDLMVLRPTMVGQRLSMMKIQTVDGRNPAPVDRWFIPLFLGFQPSKVVQDFFHPQYGVWFARQKKCNFSYHRGNIQFPQPSLSKVFLFWASKALLLDDYWVLFHPTHWVVSQSKGEIRLNNQYIRTTEGFEHW